MKRPALAAALRMLAVTRSSKHVKIPKSAPSCCRAPLNACTSPGPVLPPLTCDTTSMNTPLRIGNLPRPSMPLSSRCFLFASIPSTKDAAHLSNLKGLISASSLASSAVLGLPMYSTSAQRLEKCSFRRVSITLQAFTHTSMPIHWRPSSCAACIVVPQPQNGSSTTSPGLELALITLSSSGNGFSVGYICLTGGTLLMSHRSSCRTPSELQKRLTEPFSRFRHSLIRFFLHQTFLWWILRVAYRVGTLISRPVFGTCHLSTSLRSDGSRMHRRRHFVAIHPEQGGESRGGEDWHHRKVGRHQGCFRPGRIPTGDHPGLPY